MNGEQAPKINNAEIAPATPETKEEDFSWFEPKHMTNEGLGDIKDRLDPEPLSDAQKHELMELSMSDKSDDVVAFVEKKAELTPWQQHEFDVYRENVHLLELQKTNPQEFADTKAALSSTRLKEFNAYEQQVADEQAKLAERRANPQTPEDYLLLHSLMLHSPDEFKAVAKNLTHDQWAEFELTQTKEGRLIEKAAPEYAIPRLSSNGETWIKTESKLERDIKERQAHPRTEEDFLLLQSVRLREPERFEEIFRGLTPDQRAALQGYDDYDKAMARHISKPSEFVAGVDSFTPEQMRKEGNEAYARHQAEVNSFRATDKPKGWLKKMFGRFSRKNN